MPAIGSSTFEILEEGGLVLPPAELIRTLNLTVNTKNMTWLNADNEVVLVCANGKYDYFTSAAGNTIFMRKDVYEKYVETHTLKFFAFTERFHPDTGYADETSKHFEIEGGKIQREFYNYKNSSSINQQAEHNDCRNCPHGFYIPPLKRQNAIRDFLKAYEDALGENNNPS